MKIFYRPEQSTTDNNSFSPSAGKPALVLEAWKKLFAPLDIAPFEPVTRAQLYQVHDPKYVDGVLDCRRQNGFGNKSKGVAAALPFVSGSMVGAVLGALKDKETTVSSSSGFHHACYDHGGGYCTFNGLVLAALEAYKAGAKRVGIIDCDMHAGNGTKDIIERLHLHFIDHYSFGYDDTRPDRQQFISGVTDWVDKHVGMIETHTAEQWLKVFTVNVQDIMRTCDVVVYNAGADPHVDDPLGGVLTSEELEQRDEIVFRAAKLSKTPVAWSLAGGYQEPIEKVIAIHNTTYRVAKEWEK